MIELKSFGGGPLAGLGLDPGAQFSVMVPQPTMWKQITGALFTSPLRFVCGPNCKKAFETEDGDAEAKESSDD